MKASILAVVGGALLAGSANLALAADHEIFVDKGETKTLSSATDEDVVALLDGDKDATLLKTGEGRLIIEMDLKTPGYKGEIRVRKGFLRIKNIDACGTTGGGVVVEDGATLECDCSLFGNGKAVASNEPLTFGGFGADGSGCVKMVSGNTYNFFASSKKTMTSDAMWNGESGGFDVRFGDLDMNGKTLTLTNSVSVTGANVVNPGRIVCLGSENLESSDAFNGDDSNELVVCGGGTQELQFRDLSKDLFNWTLAISNDVNLAVRNSQNSARTNLVKAVTYNRWRGPVYLGPGTRLAAWSATYVNPPADPNDDPYHHLVNLNGKVSGPGALRTLSSGGRYGYMRVMHPANDFTGGVTVDNGTILEAASAGSLGAGPVTVGASGQLILLNGSQWDTNTLDSAELGRILRLKDQFYRNKAFGYQSTQLQVPTLGDGTYEGDLDGTIGIYHHETNVLTLTGTITGAPKAYNGAGKLVIAGAGENLLGSMYVADGTLELGAGTKTFIGEASWYVSGVYPQQPRLVVGEGAVLAARDDASTKALPVSQIGGNGVGPDGASFNREFSRGIFEVRAGAIVTNQVSVGGQPKHQTKTNDMGAVYLRGTLVQHGNNSRDALYVGAGADGYFEIGDGGFLDASKKSEWILIGSKAESCPGYGVMHVKGGKVEHHSVGFGVNDGGGYGHLRVSGGLVTNDTLIVGKSLWSKPTGGEGVVTIEGSGVVNVNESIGLGGISNSVSILNLNGGRLETGRIVGVTNQCMTSGGQFYPLDYSNANNPTYVNFNGGTYRTKDSLLALDWVSPLVTRYTVYSGGATIDCGSKSRILTAPFRNPTGKGVRSVAFACDEPWRYIGAPYVRIVDPSGAGTGASACADFDSASGLVTGVTVTSPGCDYGPDTYAEVRFGGWTNVVRASVELMDNLPSGDFTKWGSASLQQQATNECCGVVRIMEGSFAIGAPDALPNAAGFHVAEGATLYRAGYDYRPGTLSGTGHVVWDFTVAGKLTVDAADLVAGRFLTCGGSLTFAPGTKLEVLHPELLTDEMRGMTLVSADGGCVGLPEVDTTVFGPDWRITVSGGKLKFGHAHGTMLIVR